MRKNLFVLMSRKVASRPVGVFHRRIVGIETEYGITCVSSDGSRKLGADEIARFMFRPVVDTWRSSNVFLPNASRLYLDVGSHPEVATAECDAILQLLAYDRAGDEIVDRLARQAEQALAKEGVAASVYLFKNNLDSVGNSYGCHENYLVSRSAVLKALGKKLLPFLITRQLLCGAGAIKDGKFVLSQRADHVWEGVSSATTRSRPIINTRDEPHADSHRYRRLHVIVGDSNMAESSFVLKVGSTLMVLAMIETGWPLPEFDLANEIASIREIAEDITGQTAVPMKTGAKKTAIAIQREYLECAKNWLASHDDPNNEFQQVLLLWEKTVHAIETQNLAALARDIDWVIKLQLLRNFQHKLGVSDFQHPKLAQIDLAYHDIRPGRGLFLHLESKKLVNRWIDQTHITRAIDYPPDTTRAKLRGEFIAKAVEYGAPFSVDWVRLKIARPQPQVVELLDPFATKSLEVGALMEYMATHADSFREHP